MSMTTITMMTVNTRYADIWPLKALSLSTGARVPLFLLLAGCDIKTDSGDVSVLHEYSFRVGGKGNGKLSPEESYLIDVLPRAGHQKGDFDHPGGAQRCLGFEHAIVPSSNLI